jgi:rhodanese-related sulfurtransferase
MNTVVKISAALLLLILWSFPAMCLAGERAPRITPAELNEVLLSGEDLLILDVRGALSKNSKESLIKGALRLDIASIYKGEGLPEDKSKRIVTYCT